MLSRWAPAPHSHTGILCPPLTLQLLPYLLFTYVTVKVKNEFVFEFSSFSPLSYKVCCQGNDATHSGLGLLLPINSIRMNSLRPVQERQLLVVTFFPGDARLCLVGSSKAKHHSPWGWMMGWREAQVDAALPAQGLRVLKLDHGNKRHGTVTCYEDTKSKGCRSGSEALGAWWCNYERKKSSTSWENLRRILENRQRSRAWILKPRETRWTVAKKEVCLVVHINLDHLIL